MGSRAVSAAAGSSTLAIATPATPQSLDCNFDGSLGTIEAIAALYDNLLEFRKISDPGHPQVSREDIADHPDLPAGIAIGQTCSVVRTGPCRQIHPLPAATRRQEQLGQRAYRRRRQMDLGSKVRSRRDRRLLPLYAWARGQERVGVEGEIYRIDQSRKSKPSARQASTEFVSADLQLD